MTKAVIYDLFISYADNDRAWVEGYLLDALNQAGVRYYSEAAFALGVPRLLEFEHAIQKSQRILLVISPAYLTDGFSQFTDLLAQSYGLETANWPVIPLILHPVELPPRLSVLVKLNATNPDEWEEAIERLCADLQCLVPGSLPQPACPYPGMVPFTEDMSAGQETVPFQSALLCLVETPNCYLILTVRADFYSDLMSSPLWRKIQSHRLEVVPLDVAGLREAVIRPAEDVGVFVESALLERLVTDAAGEPGVLPLIQAHNHWNSLDTTMVVH